MRKLIQWFGSAALVVGLGAMAMPAQAERMYSWTTEDGVYSYTDDVKKVPARYKDQVTVMTRKSLADYKRYTPKDSSATRAYEERIAARLVHLRALNAEEGDEIVAPVAVSRDGGPSLSVATGRRSAPRVTVDGDVDAPVVIEKVRTKRRGDLVSRRTTVIRQGDRTIAVIKGDRDHHNVNDLVDEDDLH